MQETNFHAFSPQKKSQNHDNRHISEVKQRIDALLENDFNALRRGDVNLDDLLLKNHSILVLEYVKSVYNEYKLQDPLPQDPEASRFLWATPAKDKKKRKIRLTSTRTANQQTPLRQKTLVSHQNKKNMLEDQNSFDFVDDQTTIKKDYFQNTTTIRASMSCFNQEQKEDFSYSHIFPPHDCSMQEGYHQILRSRENNHMEIIIEDESRPPSEIANCDESPTINQFTQFKHGQGQNKNKLPSLPDLKKQSQTNKQDKKSLEKIDESFRYCIGCDKPLLHVNIAFHQSNCQSFQEVFKMDIEEIALYLNHKVQKIQQTIKEYSQKLLESDLNHLQQSSLRILQQSRIVSQNGIITTNFKEDYARVIDIGNKWGLMTEQINKLKWFLKIRQNLWQKFLI